MVTVIEQEELARAPEVAADELLHRLPSVAYSREYAAECGPGREITLRGIPDQKRTLILVDGVPINDGVTGAVNWSMVPKEAIERIEVVRGPMSALYGSGAMGGVVNIITRQPRAANETTIKGAYGSLEARAATLVQGGALGSGGYLVGGQLTDTRGYVQARPRAAYHVKNARRDLSLLGNAFIQPDDRSRLLFSLGWVNEDYSRGIRFDDQTNSVGRLSARYERELLPDAGLVATVYAQRLEREVDLAARPSYDAHEHTELDDATKVGQLFQADFRSGFNTITAGIDSSFSSLRRRNRYAQTDRRARARGEQMIASLFAQDELRFVGEEQRLYLTPGVRVDLCRSSDGRSLDTRPGPNPPVDEEYPDRSWMAVNPKLALVYRRAESTTLRASVGRSFAAPTLFDLYTVFTRGPVLLYGNPDLEPERAWSAELGFDQALLDRALLRATAYYTRGWNFIGSRTIAANQLEMANITGVEIYGLDSELSVDLGAHWSLYGGYTFTRPTIVRNRGDATLRGNRLPFERPHRARAGVVFRWEDWITVDLSGRYEGECYTDVENTRATRLRDYFTLDAAVSGTLIEHLRWMLAVRNGLDVRYDVYSVPTERSVAPGLLVHGSLAAVF
jgi:iron complex outermembrane receptor protein